MDINRRNNRAAEVQGSGARRRAVVPDSSPRSQPKSNVNEGAGLGGLNPGQMEGVIGCFLKL